MKEITRMNRAKLSKLTMEKEFSSENLMKIMMSFVNLSEEEKEERAVKLMKIIENSSTEEQAMKQIFSSDIY